MKKVALFIAVAVNLLLAGTVYGQNKIKFLGIPIDGTKKAMIEALKAKGYTYDSVNDVLKGEFNGKNVNISVQTINNRVWRLAVVDQSFTDGTDIKIRFNDLLRQFMNNDKYVLSSGKKLTDKDDVSYEITVHKKRYEAVFFLKDETINGCVWYMIGDRYGRYNIAMFYENLDNAANGDDL